MNKIDNYGKPNDVIEVTGYPMALENAKRWMQARELDEATYRKDELLYNVATESEESATAFVKWTKYTKDAGAFYDPLEGREIYDGVVDGLLDALVFVMVDSYKKGFSPNDRLMAVHADEFVSDIVDPKSASWFLFNSVHAYYQATMSALQNGVIPIDGDKALTEVFKELSTRRGSYSKAEGKWIKEPSTKTYKANFSKAYI